MTGDLGDFRILVQGLKTIEVAKKDGHVVVLVGGPAGKSFAPLIPTTMRLDQFGTGLPNAIITDLHYNPTAHTLLAGTFGRGAWTISDDKLTTAKACRSPIQMIPPCRTWW